MWCDPKEYWNSLVWEEEVKSNRENKAGWVGSKESNSIIMIEVSTTRCSPVGSVLDDKVRNNRLYFWFS